MKPLVHTCQGCGGSCMGVSVRPVNDSERQHLIAVAQQLKIPHPLDGDRLRLSWGRCVFWRRGVGCAIHFELGAASKPTVCRQFPRVVGIVDGDEVYATDQACFHWVDDRRPLLGLISGERVAAPQFGSIKAAFHDAGWTLEGLVDAYAAIPWPVLMESSTLGEKVLEQVLVLQALELLRVPAPGSEADQVGVRRLRAWAAVPMPLTVAEVVAGWVVVSHLERSGWGCAFAAWIRLMRAGVGLGEAR